MTLQRQQYQLSSASANQQPSVNDWGLLPTVDTPIWTPGNTIYAAPAITPNISQSWKLQSIGFTAYMALNNTTPIYGKLGKIVGGLMLPTLSPSPSTPGRQLGAGQPYTTGAGMMEPLPDPAITTTMWDPGTDPLPPNRFAAPTLGFVPATLLPIQANLQLPSPIDLYDGYPLTVGLWIFPSLVATRLSIGANTYYEMDLFNASYTLTYEDGL
jgi:hypothetical protein